jgi:hypothetical protein
MYKYLLVSHSGGWNCVHSARRQLNSLLYLPRVTVMMDNLVEWRLAGETEVFGENLLQCHFVHHKSHLPDPGSNPARRGGKPATNRLSYGTALIYWFNQRWAVVLCIPLSESMRNVRNASGSRNNVIFVGYVILCRYYDHHLCLALNI